MIRPQKGGRSTRDAAPRRGKAGRIRTCRQAVLACSAVQAKIFYRPFRAGVDKNLTRGKPWANLSWPFRPRIPQSQNLRSMIVSLAFFARWVADTPQAHNSYP